MLRTIPDLLITDPVHPEGDFKRIASDLMNRFILLSGDKRFRITEIEFYYFNERTHPDPFVHKHRLQLETGRWYFHASGLDLTFGDGKNFGGILLRAVCGLKNEKAGNKREEYFYGPLNVVTELFGQFGKASHHAIHFGLMEAQNKEVTKEEPLAATRIGLAALEGQDYHASLYRFFIMPRMRHDGKEAIRKHMIEEGRSMDQIRELFGW